MTLHACKKTSCCEEVSFLVDKKVLHFWRWEKKKNIQVSRGGGYTHPRMLLLWWKDTGTLCFVKPTLVWVFNSSFRYCWHFCSHPPIFLRLDQTVSLVFGLVDMQNNLVLNKKKAVNRSSPRLLLCYDDPNFWYELLHSFRVLIQTLRTKIVAREKSKSVDKGEKNVNNLDQSQEES